MLHTALTGPTCVGDIANYLREPTPFQRAFSPQFCHYDLHRIAALGRKFADPANLLVGVLNAAILARPVDRNGKPVTALLVDVDGLDLPEPGGTGVHLGGNREVWHLYERNGRPIVLRGKVLVVFDAITTRRQYGAERAA